MRRRGSKDVPHARRSGEVGGFLRFGGLLGGCWAGWCVACWLAHGWLLAAGWEDDEEEGFQGSPTRSTLWRGRRISKDLAGWLVAGCWLDGEEGFKDFSHARRSGEVGGYQCRRNLMLGALFV